jgi:hypothetical protein
VSRDARYPFPSRRDLSLALRSDFLGHARRFGDDRLFVGFRHFDGLVGELGNRLAAGNRTAVDSDFFTLQGDLLLHRVFHDIAADTSGIAADRPLADCQAFLGQPDGVIALGREAHGSEFGRAYARALQAGA